MATSWRQRRGRERRWVTGHYTPTRLVVQIRSGHQEQSESISIELMGRVALDVRMCVCMPLCILRIYYCRCVSGTTNIQGISRVTAVDIGGPYTTAAALEPLFLPDSVLHSQGITTQQVGLLFHLDDYLRHGEVLSPHALGEDCEVQRRAVLPLVLQHDILGLHQESVRVQHWQRQQRLVGRGGTWSILVPVSRTYAHYTCIAYGKPVILRQTSTGRSTTRNLMRAVTPWWSTPQKRNRNNTCARL